MVGGGPVGGGAVACAPARPPSKTTGFEVVLATTNGADEANGLRRCEDPFPPTAGLSGPDDANGLDIVMRVARRPARARCTPHVSSGPRTRLSDRPMGHFSACLFGPSKVVSRKTRWMCSSHLTLSRANAMASLPSAAFASRTSFSVVTRQGTAKPTLLKPRASAVRVTATVGDPPTGATSSKGTLKPLNLDASVPFYQIRAMIRPWRLNDVLVALETQGVRGLTTYDALGAGVQAGSVERYRGATFDEQSGIRLVEKTVLEVVLERNQVQDIVDTIVDAAQTGEIGDGKIFITPIADVVRIRTGETGVDAERMAGGRSSMGKK